MIVPHAALHIHSFFCVLVRPLPHWVRPMHHVNSTGTTPLPPPPQLFILQADLPATYADMDPLLPPFQGLNEAQPGEPEQPEDSIAWKKIVLTVPTRGARCIPIGLPFTP